MKKKVLTVLLTGLLLLSLTALGISTLFRVEKVALFARFSAQTEVTEEELQAELIDAYKKESIFSADKKKAEKIVEKYPYLRIVGYTKSYPDKLSFWVVEDSETYAVATEKGYYILNAEGILVDERADNYNREDNAPNVLVRGVTASGRLGEALEGDDAWQTMLSLCRSMDNALGGIRKNVDSVEVFTRAPQTVYLFRMREGVSIYIEQSNALTKEQAEAAIEKYFSLSQEERMRGRITVRAVEGEALAEYKQTDEF